MKYFQKVDMSNKNLFMESAITIGKQISKEAYWYKNLCNWMGSNKLFSNIHKVNKTHIKIALGPDIYNGTSGIAFFLANLYNLCKDEEFLSTSEGSIRHALSRINLVDSKTVFGFYTGIVGIAYVANKIGNIFDDKFLKKEALSLMDYLSKRTVNKHLMDFISGNAGAIPAILDIYNTTNEKSLLLLSTRLGDELILRSIRTHEGVSWNYTSNGIRDASKNLTGFSHGAAGMAYGLLKLYSVTNNEKYRQAAELALEYENNWYSEKEKNWPDFRHDERQNKKAQKIKYARAWCHGAQGIGLSRLYAYTLLNKKKYYDDLAAAIENTIDLITHDVLYEFDFSPCHGLAGICELLICSSLELNHNTLRKLAEDIGLFGIKEYKETNKPWPLGIEFGDSPALMTGKAGIGLFYLRLADPYKVDSILML